MSGMELLLLGATGLSAGAQLMQGREEARVLGQNAAMAELEAEKARKAAASDAAATQEDAERTMGAARAIGAASGFDGSGSALDILADLAGQKRYNTSAIIYGGDEERRALLAEAASLKKARNAVATNTMLNVGATILSGGYRASQLDRAAAGGVRTGRKAPVLTKPSPTTRTTSIKVRPG
jgi:hypothetical protein